jgi:hypothetical protein
MRDLLYRYRLILLVLVLAGLGALIWIADERSPVTG